MNRLQQLYWDCLLNNQYLETEEERALAANAMAGAINWALGQNRAYKARLRAQRAAKVN